MSSMDDIQTLKDAGFETSFSARNAVELGIHTRRLGHMITEGLIEKCGRGLYRFPDPEAKASELESIARASAAVPNAIVCLATALYIHHIGTRPPHPLWLATDRKTRIPRDPPVQSRIVRFSGAMLTYGVEQRTARDVPFRITTPARTVVDCFRFRKHCGHELAMEALYDVIRRGVVKEDELKRAAEICRVRTIITPYIDAFGWVDSLA